MGFEVKEYLEIKALIKEKLECGDFQAAEKVYLANDLLISGACYLEVIYPFIQRLIKRKSDYDALSNSSEKEMFQFVRKTIIGNMPSINYADMIALITKLFIKYYEISPEQLFILSDQKEITEKINIKLNSLGVDTKFAISMTYFKLVVSIFNERYKIVEDYAANPYVTNDVLGIIQNIIRQKSKNNIFPYNHFIEQKHSECEQLNRYRNRRNFKRAYVTLDGIKVKSKGERYIGDFLFEHGFDYEYEKVFDWKGKNYNPDFFFSYGDKSVIIEHWAIGSDHSRGWDLDTPKEEYIIMKQEKVNFWKEKGEKYIFIETSIDDLLGSRYEFEIILNNKLINEGVFLRRKNEKEIAKNVKAKSKDRISRFFYQFIIHAKKCNFSPNTIRNSIDGGSKLANYQKLFVEALIDVYQAYEESKRPFEYDFYDLISLSIGKIEKATNSSYFSFDSINKISFADVRFIFLNEFPDFPPVLFDLLIALKGINPNVVFIFDYNQFN